MIRGRASAPARGIGGRLAPVTAGMAMAAFGGCDRDVPLTEGPDAAGADVAVLAYKGATMQTLPTPFGGSPFCNYTITLEQIEIDLDISSSGSVVAGRVQHLSVETTEASCPHDVIPAMMSRYALRSAVAHGAGMQLDFQGDSRNYPVTSLVVDLSHDGTAYSAMLSFHRIDIGPPLDWSVVATLPLYPQL